MRWHRLTVFSGTRLQLHALEFCCCCGIYSNQHSISPLTNRIWQQAMYHCKVQVKSFQMICDTLLVSWWVSNTMACLELRPNLPERRPNLPGRRPNLPGRRPNLPGSMLVCCRRHDDDDDRHGGLLPTSNRSTPFSNCGHDDNVLRKADERKCGLCFISNDS